MKQKQYTVESTEALEAVLSEIAGTAEYKSASTVLVHIMTNVFSIAEATNALTKVRAALPRAKTVGLSNIQFRKEDDNKKYLQLSVCYFEHAEVEG